MIKKKFIVSGTYDEYLEYIHKKNRDISNGNTEYIYVNSVKDFMGVLDIEGFYIGTYFKRADIDDIKERIAIAKRIKADNEANYGLDALRSPNGYTNEYSVENYFDMGNGRYVSKKEYTPAENSVYGNVTGYIVEPVTELDNNHVVDYKVNRLFSG
jgi:hypothetical protein